ncbi:MAG: response regulator [Bacteroidota bacterium]|nr:response regulator [Ferruginibacter sp.]
MKVVNILLVDDDYVDAMDIKRNLDKTQILYKLDIKKNGEEAVQFLEDSSKTTQTSLPDVVLVDINMPRMNGIEFLGAVRGNPKWQHLKCFMVTTSGELVDKQAVKQLGVSGYIEKPLKLTNPTSMDGFNLMIDLMNA